MHRRSALHPSPWRERLAPATVPAHRPSGRQPSKGRNHSMPDIHPVEGQIFPVKPEIAGKAHITAARYQDMFERAQRDPDGFWGEQSRRIAWMKAPTRIKNTSFAGNVAIKWFEDGTL